MTLATTFALILTACGGAEFPIVGRGAAAGSYGYISVSPSGQNDDLRVQLDMRNLPQPGRVVDGASVYVSWVVPPGRTAQKLGVVDYDPYQRAAFVRGTTTFHRFEITLTAELHGEVERPSSVIVARKSYPPGR